MTLEEQLKQLKEKLVNIVESDKGYLSEVFNTNLSSTYSKKIIDKIKFSPRVSLKCLFPLVIRMPFDPFTGKEGEKAFNRTLMGIVPGAPDDVLRAIKYECNNNKELKEFYIRTAGFKGEWDTSDASNIYYEQDKFILWRYRYLFMAPIATATITDPAVSGQQFASTYLLPTKQNALTGEFEGDISQFHQLASLVGSLSREEINSFNAAISSSNPDCISRKMKRTFTLNENFLADIGDVDSIPAKTRRGEIRDCYPVSSPRPITPVVALTFNITPRTGTIKEKIDGKLSLVNDLKDPGNLRDRVTYTVTYQAIEVLHSILGNYFPKNPRDYQERSDSTDLYVNYVLMDYITESTVENFTSKDAKMNAAKDMKFATEKKTLCDVDKSENEIVWEHPDLAQFDNSIKEFYEVLIEEDYILQIVNNIKSTLSVVTETITQNLSNVIAKKFPTSLPIYNPIIKGAFSGILVELFPDEYLELSEAAETLETEDNSSAAEELIKIVTEQNNSVPDYSEEDGDYAVIGDLT